MSARVMGVADGDGSAHAMAEVTVQVPTGRPGDEPVLVRIRETDDAVTRVGRGTRAAVQATRTLDQMLDAVRPVAESFVSRFTQMENPPDEIGLEFGISLTAGADVVIATTGTEANFTVTLNWSDISRRAG
ncbi:MULTISPECIES: CU044_2847 family protein [unclassified Streptomyces]|uniref:CU044_2847 family protein n=2 Tax=unclassified Streptomyces TaxID=2593676 RepID=UPI003626F43D